MALWKMLLWLELEKVGNSARCSGRVVCIARKTLYSCVYFVCTHTKYMVSGDCTLGVCTAQIYRVHTARGVSTPISMLATGAYIHSHNFRLD